MNESIPQAQVPAEPGIKANTWRLPGCHTKYTRVSEESVKNGSQFRGASFPDHHLALRSLALRHAQRTAGVEGDAENDETHKKERKKRIFKESLI